MGQQEMVAETARAASVAAAAAAASAIPPMTWGGATPAAFLAQWAGIIAVQDPHGKEEDPHVYLIKKLFQTLETVRRPGSYGHQFWTAGPSSCVPAFVWADGSPQQLTEYGTQQLTEYAMWWPCIVLVCDAQTPVLPFYCPALAWQQARPWGVHVTRVRRRPCIVDSSALSTAQQHLPLSIFDSSATPAAPPAGGRASSDAAKAEKEDGAPSGTQATARRNRWTRARDAARVVSSGGRSDVARPVRE